MECYTDKTRLVQKKIYGPGLLTAPGVPGPGYELHIIVIIILSGQPIFPTIICKILTRMKNSPFLLLPIHR
jgi:hypothetical protein